MQKLPLSNIKVLDFTQVRMGPQMTQWLAVMGADVLRVETKLRPVPFQDVGRPGRLAEPVKYRIGYFASLNYSKKSITLNMKSPKAIELVKKLLKHIDIITENFSTGVLDRWGLSYAELKKIKPDIIVCSASGFGRTGYMKDAPAYAPIIGAYSGFCYDNGYPDGEPAEPGCRGWTDSITAEQGVFAILAALYHRNKTGEGQYLDLSMTESEIAMSPESALEYFINNRIRPRQGNQDAIIAPHNCYRCKGKDTWVAIACGNDDDWAGLCKAMGKPKWTKDAKFGDALSRWENRDEMDRLIEIWTTQYDHYEAMALLQKAGVPAGASLNIEELAEDPHLKERGFLVELEYPDKSTIHRLALPFNLSESGRGYFEHPPAPGEHNDYIFKEVMGMSDEEIKQLEAEQVIY